MVSKRKNKKKERGEHQRIYIRRSIKKGGLKGIDKRVGSWGKKRKRKKAKEKSTGRAPADGHRSIKKDGSNQTVNFPKQNIILILADDVGVY